MPGGHHEGGAREDAARDGLQLQDAIRKAAASSVADREPPDVIAAPFGPHDIEGERKGRLPRPAVVWFHQLHDEDDEFGELGKVLTGERQSGRRRPGHVRARMAGAADRC